MPSDPQRLELVARGRVQGVYYRASMLEQARALGLRGWVRNEPDGSVRAVAEGPRDALEVLVRWAERGPPAACVDAVETTWSAPDGSFAAFTIARQ
jgi:acylphosphatase